MPESPGFNIPSGAVASLSMFDTTSTIDKVALHYVVEPTMTNVSHMPKMNCWSFLIENDSGRKVLYDLGIRKDWHNYAPVVSNRLKASGWDIRVEKNMTEVLGEAGYKGEDFEAVIWRYGL